jgi:hypothetical protein
MTIQNKNDKEAMPLEALETLAALIQDKNRTKSTGTSPETTDTSHIVDITEQYVGKSLIITGAELPNNQPIVVEPGEAPGTGIITATEKPPRK